MAHSTGGILRDAGARVSTLLTNGRSHYGPSLVGRSYAPDGSPGSASIVDGEQIELIVPTTLDWLEATWGADLVSSGVPIFGVSGEAARIERERAFGRELCRRFGIAHPEAHVATSLSEAVAILGRHDRPLVIKNAVCSASNRFHTIVCETAAETRTWLEHISFDQPVFLQEYVGRREAGHVALVSGGEIYPLVTNQEYKRAYTGNLGVTASMAQGGIVEWDPDDRYGLARSLILPLLPWLREVDYHGPLQVTAIRGEDQWRVVEHNVRLGTVSGAMLLRMLRDPLDTLRRTAIDAPLVIEPRDGLRFGCSVSVLSFGYPYEELRGPKLPVEIDDGIDCDLWWNDVACAEDGTLRTTGRPSRIADVVAFGPDLRTAVDCAYANVDRVRAGGSYHRLDIGTSLWPPGSE